jgi:hypothetical protein
VCMFFGLPRRVLMTVGGRKSTSNIYYKEMKREINGGPIYECRCDERLTVVFYEEAKKRESNRVFQHVMKD